MTYSSGSSSPYDALDADPASIESSFSHIVVAFGRFLAAPKRKASAWKTRHMQPKPRAAEAAGAGYLLLSH
jgi:hypothetical protein